MLIEYHPSNHGFAVLKRVEEKKAKSAMPLADDHLKNKMILSHLRKFMSQRMNPQLKTSTLKEGSQMLASSFQLRKSMLIVSIASFQRCGKLRMIPIFKMMILFSLNMKVSSSMTWD
jgi:hypothetical protein